MTDLSRAVWRVSSYTGGNGGNCVEVADNMASIVAVRDSKDREGPALVLPVEAWRSFLAGIREHTL